MKSLHFVMYLRIIQSCGIGGSWLRPWIPCFHYRKTECVDPLPCASCRYSPIEISTMTWWKTNAKVDSVKLVMACNFKPLKYVVSSKLQTRTITPLLTPKPWIIHTKAIDTKGRNMVSEIKGMLVLLDLLHCES